MKNLLKKITYICLFLFVFLGFFHQEAYAQEVRFYLAPSEKAVVVGGTIETKVYLETQPSGYNILGYDLKVKYDSQILRVTKVTPDTSRFDKTTNNNSTAGLIALRGSNTSNRVVSGEGILLGTILFQAQKTGTTAVSFENPKIFDLDRGEVLFSPAGATYTVMAAASGTVSPTHAAGASSPTPRVSGSSQGSTSDSDRCDGDGIQTDLGCIPTDPAGFVAKFYGIGLGLIGGIALLFIMYGGYLIMSSSGNPAQLANGKSYIVYAIIGLLFAIFGYAFIQIVIVDVLHIPGFS